MMKVLLNDTTPIVKEYWLMTEQTNYPDMVKHAYNTSTLGGYSKKMASSSLPWAA